ncbi:hypothetical protein EVAR_593_1 [Eumeta japonica]|uniref:Uncharacterized protein n=1 Tax=Eumeta variegata TaxID=151549 RepID=A0A4C1SBY9_EUMVA|nr:hypothetical protein EVAR_593_1 [Eumeta japonica]
MLEAAVSAALRMLRHPSVRRRRRGNTRRIACPAGQGENDTAKNIPDYTAGFMDYTTNCTKSHSAEIEYSELSEAPQNIETTRSIYEPSTSKQKPSVNQSNYTMDNFSYYTPQGTSVNNEDNIQSTLIYTPTPILRCQDENIETSDYQNIEANDYQNS